MDNPDFSTASNEPNDSSGMVRLRAGTAIERLNANRFLVLQGATGERFEIDVCERYLLQLLLEKSSVSDVRVAYAQRFSPLEVRDVLEFVELLHGLQLLEDPTAETESPFALSREAFVRDAAAARSPTTSAPTPLSRGDRGGWVNTIFDSLALVCGWMSSAAMFWLVLLLAILGANVLLRYWGELLADSQDLWRDWHPLPLSLAVYSRIALFLSLPSALLTGMIGRQYGGRIRKFELFLWEDVLPLFRVDLGDSIAIVREKGRRRMIWVNMLFPVALAGASLVMWRMCDNNSARIFWLLAIPPALVSSVLRWNIFSESGGYFLLCDWSEDWKLRERARGETWAWLTLSRAPAPLTVRERFWLRAYGVGELFYRMLREALLLIGGALLLTTWVGGAGAAIYAVLVAWRYRKSAQIAFGSMLAHIA